MIPPTPDELKKVLEEIKDIPLPLTIRLYLATLVRYDQQAKPNSQVDRNAIVALLLDRNGE